MSEKLSAEIARAANAVACGEPVGSVSLCAMSMAAATLERALAEMTRQRDEALKEPTTQELINAAQHEFDAFKPDDVLLVALFVTARRKRILGDA